MKRRYVFAIITFFMMVVSISMNIKWSHMKADLAGKVFRFHVLANSDRAEDQELKMQVKEEIIAYMKQELPVSEGVDMTKAWARDNLHSITDRAQRLVKQKGYDYTVTAEVTTCDFPEKSYGDITFPAGEYEALRIEIGEAKGQNWWCVLYPNLCFIDAVHAVVPEESKAELKEVLEEDTYKMVTATTPFRLKWFFF